MLTTNTSLLPQGSQIDGLTARVSAKVRMLLKYARKICEPNNDTSLADMNEATLRDIGLSRYELKEIARNAR